MEPKEQQRAPRISGVTPAGDQLFADYSANLMNVVLFFEPVSRDSLEAVELIRLMSARYEKLSVGFWYVMEPRLSCMLKSEIAQRTLDRLSLFSNVFFDVNNMIILHSGVKALPAVLVVDSNGYVNSRFEGEISFMEIERSVQSRLAASGYRDELPLMSRFESTGNHLNGELAHARGASTMRQLGYATADYVLGGAIAPETSQEFSLPGFCLIDTIYPFGSWFVGRDFIGGNSGSTVYISCGREESVRIFAGAQNPAVMRMHTSIESPQGLSLGRDIRNDDGPLSLEVSEFRPYEILSGSGDSDVLISLQVMDGTVQMYAVEFSPRPLAHVGNPDRTRKR